MIHPSLLPSLRPRSLVAGCMLGLLTAVCPLADAGAQTAVTERFTVPINGAQISYTTTGTGATTIVLIHGYPLNGNLFVKQRNAFGAEFRVITVDLRGFGQSIAPNDSASVNLYAQDVLLLLNQLGINQAIIGGHSLGGAIALSIYQSAPDRVTGLILNDAAAFPPPIVEQSMWQGYQVQTRESGRSSLLPLLVPEFLSGETRVRSQRLVNKVTRLIQAASVNGFVGGARALETRPGFAAVFPTITVPTLIIYGQEDTLTPIPQAGMLQQMIAGSRLVVIAGASHGVIREKPAESNAAIAQWLDDNFGTNARAATATAVSTESDED